MVTCADLELACLIAQRRINCLRMGHIDLRKGRNLKMTRKGTKEGGRRRVRAKGAM